MTLTIDIPGLRLVSEANQREHWRVRHARKKRQQASVNAHLLVHSREWRRLKPPYRVIVTRRGKRKLDSDNLQGSAKHVRDQIASALGVNDGDEKAATWEVRQELAREYGCLIVIAGVNSPGTQLVASNGDAFCRS